MIEQPASSSSATGRKSPIVGIVQLVIAAVAAFLAWRSLTNGTGTASAGFWGWVALFLFCGLLALLNLLAPALRSRFAGEPLPARRLPVRLPAIDGAPDTILSIFALGIAFGAPAFPLFMMWLRMRDSDLALLVIGACLGSAVVGAIMLFLSVSNLYKLLAVGEAAVEVAKEPALAGEALPAFISYRQGRLTPVRIEARLVCRKTIRVRRRSSSSGTSTTTQVKIVHDALFAGLAIPDGVFSGLWQEDTTIPIPADAWSTTRPDTYPTIDWSVDLVVTAANAPDFRLGFPLKVVGPELPDEEPDDEELEDEEPRERSAHG